MANKSAQISGIPKLDGLINKLGFTKNGALIVVVGEFGSGRSLFAKQVLGLPVAQKLYIGTSETSQEIKTGFQAYGWQIEDGQLMSIKDNVLEVMGDTKFDLTIEESKREKIEDKLKDVEVGLEGIVGAIGDNWPRKLISAYSLDSESIEDTKLMSRFMEVMSNYARKQALVFLNMSEEFADEIELMNSSAPDMILKLSAEMSLNKGRPKYHMQILVKARPECNQTVEYDISARGIETSNLTRIG
jgi:KaiC/GvpD/RAD55 family RecA-like ATPase